LLSELDRDVLEIDIELLETCRNDSAARALVDAWRRRVETTTQRKERGSASDYDPFAAREFAKILARLELGIVRHQERAASRLRPLLADQNAEVRVAAYRLLGCVGSLRDVALLSDLLTLAPSASDHPRERVVIAESMHRIARRESATAGDE
jgi:hypothetical protein